MIKTKVTGVRLTPEALAKLEAIAAADRRPVSALMRKILEEWLDAQPNP